MTSQRCFTTFYFIIIFIIACFLGAVSCKKPIDKDAILSFSCENNTITFDTVFTSIGSATQKFTVHNTSNQDVKTTIFLQGGTKSNYSINVNGMPGAIFKDVEIPKKDSIYIFVKVNIDPGNINNPFLVTDAIVFVTGSKDQEVALIAYGQDANFIVADQGSGNLRYKIVAEAHQTVIWTKDKPYVVYGGYATIDSLGKLIIEPGTKIYFHKNSGLWAYRYSKLEVGDNLGEPVLFRNDRLELAYDALWDRIMINEGADVTIQNAIITDATVGIQVESLPDKTLQVESNVVKIENTIIKNIQISGVISRFLNVEMTNCVISNTGDASMILEGGNYKMKHITIANYSMQKERKNPACYVSNRSSIYIDENTKPLPYDVKAEFVNCIIYGKIENEVYIDKDDRAECEVEFQNCLLKAKDNSSYFNTCWRNEDPKFADKDKQDYNLLSGSPAIGKGKVLNDVPLDILGNPRGNKPDLGAYQFVR